MSLHPIETTEYLRSTYERYLKTIYPFRDPALQRQFWKELAQTERLVKGPMLESSPPFKHGRSIAELVTASMLHKDFRALCQSTQHLEKAPLPYTRPLYLHQERAIVNVVQNNRNLIVSTGTGSGKTESFLIPILNHLLQEKEAGTLSSPGVRALLLYPMNALANDQLDRLRVLLQAFPAFTFGRYTGETLEDQKDAETQYLGLQHSIPLLKNELHSRQQIRSAPPHLLLTNYAMLEYLLLRPQDTELFDGPTGRHWQFIVVDEAHVYDGAGGIEVAMLLRRLKDRLLAGSDRRLTCIATSATLGKGKEDFPKVAEFGNNLFDEPFAAEDVVEAERQPVSALGVPWGEGSRALYADLHRPIQTRTSLLFAEDIANIAAKHSIDQGLIEEIRSSPDGVVALYTLLSRDARLHNLQTSLQRRPALLTEIAGEIFPSETAEAAQEAMVHLVDLSVFARPAGDSLPLLPARYHTFARALEGAFACLNHTAHSDGEPRLFLSRHERCPEQGCKAQVFEVATCARCGTSFIVGEESLPSVGSGVRHLQPIVGDLPAPDGAKRAYYILSAELPEANEDEISVDNDEDNPDPWSLYSLCLHCGAIAEPNSTACNCSGEKTTIRKAPFDGTNEDAMYCPACSTRSRGVVYRLLTGRDAPVAVLASALYTELPPADEVEMLELPGQGRKLLMFADSRQDAAFFAPYLQRTFDGMFLII